MNFGDIVGQKEIIENLKNSIVNEKVGHAYIFSGPRGIGKRTVARMFASALLCNSYKNGAACGECMPCLMLANGSDPDFHEIDAEGTSIGIDEIRNVQSDVHVRPLYSFKKVYLIINAERMTLQAQNCLLKTLEEPPLYTVFILTASNSEALIDTIQSRAVRYNFKKNSFTEVRGFLLAKAGKNVSGIDFIASYADGVIGAALNLADSDEFVEIRERTIDTLVKLSKSKLIDVFGIYKFFEDNKDDIEMIFDTMISFYRDLLLVKMDRFENVLINSDKKDIILSNACNFSLNGLIRNIEEVELTRRSLKQNANYQLAIEVMLMKLQEELS